MFLVVSRASAWVSAGVQPVFMPALSSITRSECSTGPVPCHLRRARSRPLARFVEIFSTLPSHAGREARHGLLYRVPDACACGPALGDTDPERQRCEWLQQSRLRART